MIEEVRERFLKIVEPVVVAKGLELIELNLDVRNHLYRVEVLVDRLQGGISLEECVSVTKALNDALEFEPEDYELTVASPGLDRPLKTEKDFLRTLGQPVRFVLKEKVEGKGEYSGQVKSVGSQAVLVTLADRDISIPLDKIMKAVLVV